LFVTSNAALISSAPIPRRRIVPARLVNVSLSRPSGMMAPIAALPFARNVIISGYIVVLARQVTINNNSKLSGGLAADRLTLNSHGLLKLSGPAID
jgi:hypothetical protein